MINKPFKMKDVQYSKKQFWNPDCMTKHWEWVAVVGDDIIASDYKKIDLMERVRAIYRRKLQNVR